VISFAKLKYEAKRIVAGNRESRELWQETGNPENCGRKPGIQRIVAGNRESTR
jgi:hypothetical protein